MIRVGVIDSGFAGPALAAAGFVLDDSLLPCRVEAAPDASGHGGAIAALIREAAPEAGLLNAQVFRDGLVASAAAVAAALDWLRAEGAALACLSLGLRADRAVLRRACAAAVEAGMLLVAASPARGPKTWPAAYDGVLRCTGDARCAPGEVSRLLDGHVFGACPRLPAGLPQDTGGASFAAGRVCGLLAAALADGRLGAPAGAASFLGTQARYHGPERRSAADA